MPKVTDETFRNELSGSVQGPVIQAGKITGPVTIYAGAAQESRLIIPGEETDRLSSAAVQPQGIDTAAIDALAGVTAATRTLEDSIGSAAVLPQVVQHAQLIERFAREARSRNVRKRALEVTGDVFQFLGWLRVATGDLTAAGQQFDRLTTLALEADHEDLLVAALSWRGYVAEQERHLGSWIDLSQATQRYKQSSTALRAYTAFQEARGHAMAGDVRTAERVVDDATKLAADAEDEPRPPWAYWYTSAFFRLERGTAFRLIAQADPSRTDKAITELQAGLDGLVGMDGAEWAADFRLELARAHLQVGDPESAAVASDSALDVALSTGSVMLLDQVADLYDEQLGHTPDVAAVRELGDRLQTLRSSGSASS